MPAQTKRRRLTLYSLPVVVAVGFLLVARLAAWQQSDIVADLADCIAHGEAREASDAVRKLSAMPNPPVSVLVTAAAADDHQTADTGQVAISKLLHRWQRDIEKKNRVSAVASQLCELAEALDKQQRDFPSSDHQWLAITAGKILRLANALPAAKTPLLAIHCDAILAAVDAGGAISISSAEDGTSVGGKTNEAAPTAPSVTSAISNNDQSNSAPTSNSQAAGPIPVDNSANSASKESLFNIEDDAAGASQDIARPAAINPEDSAPVDGGKSWQEVTTPNQFKDSEHARPILRILPGKSEGVAPTEKVSANDSRKSPVAEDAPSTPQNLPVASSDLFSDLESKELLQQWRSAKADDAQPIERELARRGFGRVTKPLVQLYFSDNADERMRLVDIVLAHPGGGAGAWLLLLAEDLDPEVRLFAVTLMATSNNASLVDKAWQVSIRDHDPRIADLANRLRERRAGTLRR